MNVYLWKAVYSQRCSTSGQRRPPCTWTPAPAERPTNSWDDADVPPNRSRAAQNDLAFGDVRDGGGYVQTM